MRVPIVCLIVVASLAAGCFFYFTSDRAALVEAQGRHAGDSHELASGSSVSASAGTDLDYSGRIERASLSERNAGAELVRVEDVVRGGGISFLSTRRVLTSASFYDDVERFRINSGSASSVELTKDYRNYIEAMLAKEEERARVKQVVCSNEVCVGSLVLAGNGEASRVNLRNAMLNSDTQGIYGFVDDMVANGAGSEYRFVFSNNPAVAKISVGK